MHFLSQSEVVGALAYEPLLATLRRVRRRNCVISLMYHEVLPDHASCDAWTVVMESKFHAQMLYLKRNFDVVSIDEALKRLSQRDSGKRPTAIVTFDDGYLGNKQTVWPIVRELEIPITIFVSTSAVKDQSPYWYDRLIAVFSSENAVVVDLRDHGLKEYRINHQESAAARWDEKQRMLADLKSLLPGARASALEVALQHFDRSARSIEPLSSLSIGDIQEMAQSPLITFGAHSHCHSILTQLPRDQVMRSVQLSKHLLEEWTNMPIRHFAYPNGDFNDVVVGVVRECGFITSQATTPGVWRPSHSLFSIPRISVGRYDSHDWYRAQISGLAWQ